MKIVQARPADAAALTEIAFAAKRHWGYPERWIEAWRKGLTVCPEFVAGHETYAAILEGYAAGFYALGFKDGRLELLHMWVWPAAMGRGVGRALYNHAIECGRGSGSRELHIVSDPNAEGFYLRMGAQRVGVKIRRVHGQRRELPVLIHAF